MKIFFKKSFTVFWLAIWFLPTASFAAEMILRVPRDVFYQGENISVEVYLDTEDARINALEGRVVFPAEMLELKEIRDGNSAINFWVEKPKERAPGEVSFSGITAGGFVGENKFLFTVVFEAVALGGGSVELDGLRMLQNDGVGTPLSTTSTAFNFSIVEGVPRESGEAEKDTDPPEKFEPYLGRDEALFDGKYFIVWSTVDKGSGMDHYEVREGFWGKYEVGESPYSLRDQGLRKNIYVKAVDKSQNERIAKLRAPNANVWLEAGAVLVIILIAGIFVFRKKIWLKRNA